MNGSYGNSTADSDYPLWLTDTQITAMTVLYSITVICALAGNSLLIFIVTRRQETRRLTSFLFVNMAIADLIITLTVLPATLAMPYTDSKWLPGVLGQITCKAVYAVFHVSITASIFSLTLMALDRFLAVVFPMSRFPSFRQVKVLTSLIWMSSVILMIPAGVLWTVREHDGVGSYCEPMFEEVFGDFQKGVTGFYTYLFLTTYLIPLLTISILYCLVCCNLWLQKLPGEKSLRDVQKRRHEVKKKIVRTLVIVTAAFAVCWLPANTYHLILAFNEELHSSSPRFMMSILFWCGHANSAINPWLYMLLTNQFRKCLGDLVRTTRSKSTFWERETYV
ncbi:prolactin-releasing peptide receptor-like isoform X1 [Montipora foliosa]|uniref:prolactin-releasing peptide receptor-like isoform X1 n=2 Tax=Montipora foliosa TaxID=591990 RepID=UPI0035F1E1C0